GEFSSKFAAVTAAAPHLEASEVIESPQGTHPELEPNPDVDAYAFPHNETSTGVAMEVRRPPGAEGLVLTDATSGAAGLRVDPTQFDAYYFAPQKGFASDGGLWIAALSPAAVERIARIKASDRWAPPFLDLSIAVENSRLDQTYNTPALATLFLMVSQLEWILEQGGLAWSTARCDRSAEIVYGWADASTYATPFVANKDDRSHVVATLDLDEAVDAPTVAKVLRANGIVDTESYRKLGRNQLRIAMFVAVEPDTGAVLDQGNAHEPLPPASVTKVLTALIATEQIQPGADIPISAEAQGMPARNMNMKAGQVFKFEDILHALLMVSANDAAV